MPSAIPTSLGSKTMQSIGEKTWARSTDSIEDDTRIVHSPIYDAVERPRFYIRAYQYSRFQKIKSYIYIDLLLIICITLFSVANIPYSSILAATFTVPVAIITTWTAVMVILNLYFRACLKSSDKDSNKNKGKNLSGNKELALAIFPKPAKFVEPAE